jgi:NAD(P)-dependent dehydrogenase (short-subunit alcohol dehydrogenase family)
MTNGRTILITGVTGNQGGAVAQALEGDRAAALVSHFVDNGPASPV